MRNFAQYLKLWQQKRSELPVNIDPQMDWLDMQRVLDKHMPVDLSGANSGNSGSGGSSSIVTKLALVAKFKLLYSAVALIVAASVTYYAVTNIRQQKNNKPKKEELRRDSLLNASPDSVLADSALLDSTRVNEPAVNVNADSLSDNPSTQNNNPAVNNASNSNNEKAGNAIAGANTSANNTVNTVDKLRGVNSLNNNASRINTNNKNINKAGSPHKPVLLAGAVRRGNGSRNRLNTLSKPFANSRNTLYSNADLSLNSSLAAVNSNRVNSNRSRYNAANTTGDSILPSTVKQSNDRALLTPTPSPVAFNWMGDLLPADNGAISASNNNTVTRSPPAVASAKTVDKKVKSSKISNGLSLINFDWGILSGVSTSTEAHIGLFTTYNFNDKWAIGTQLRLFTPYSIKGSYTAPNKSKKDTNQVLQISDTRKLQTADVPLYLIYHITDKISVKGGPVLTIPLKQTGVSDFTTATRKDSTGYYSTVTNDLNQTRYNGKINVGLTGGVGLNFDRWLVDVTWYQGLQTQQVNSPLGNYSFTRKGAQLTIGFKLNSNKR